MLPWQVSPYLVNLCHRDMGSYIQSDMHPTPYTCTCRQSLPLSLTSLLLVNHNQMLYTWYMSCWPTTICSRNCILLMHNDTHLSSCLQWFKKVFLHTIQMDGGHPASSPRNAGNVPELCPDHTYSARDSSFVCIILIPCLVLQISTVKLARTITVEAYLSAFIMFILMTW